MKKYFLDTDVLIDYSKGRDRLVGELLEKQKKKKCELWVNVVVITEFFTDKNLEDDEKYKKARDFFGFLGQIEIGEKIALKTAELLRKKQVDYLADGYIAASCLVANLVLVTRNKKHFGKVNGLKLYKS